MHSPETIQHFLDLRSKGNCLAYISQAINVPLSTLGDWNRRYVLEIDAARAAKWESAEQSIQFNPEADLVRITQRLHVFERELDRRSITHMTTTELVRVISLWRREYFRRRNPLLAPIERPRKFPEIPSVTPEVTRGLTSQDPSTNTTAPSADAAHDADKPTAATNPEPESKPEKTGIPDSPASHLPTFSPAHLPGSGEGDSKNQTGLNHTNPPPAPPPPLFSLEDHLPIPARGWRPSENLIYPPS